MKMKLHRISENNGTHVRACVSLHYLDSDRIVRVKASARIGEAEVVKFTGETFCEEDHSGDIKQSRELHLVTPTRLVFDSVERRLIELGCTDEIASMLSGEARMLIHDAKLWGSVKG